ncbi:1-deoxy-D-xylulose 5-phosphate reductoisomerase [Flexivirga endophytica]|uniref:1-deoxy-D-xylulose 5-phosphate reductoisomerase n=1 Tax=Flexivirga endophytica TaxID=1849103 RepID=A0A916TDY8_9MICO|nr:1-deoxy-D-xylulose-5-phosphate reductoisomerase [Flexivirga endophytica]GGB39969.1 1-deoxy-D-xylulose 5-phosphate reductoisomerase [Flexivirga endophytica]GHB47861.1 1-deoxy-D-xylulose 5-phosphate reductoisomerase [Flexivirga endophytica]
MTETSAAAPTQRSVAILGSTGSIGTQALDIIARNPDRFRVVALSAGGAQPRLIAQQAVQSKVSLVGLAVGDTTEFREMLDEEARAAGISAYRPELFIGLDAAEQVAACGADVVLNGITGSIGLRPTMAALGSGATLALANKESLIVGGPIVKGAARPGQIVPVDSEHSAIAQSLRAGSEREVRRLVVTASGGPFRGMPFDELKKVSPQQALAHPNFAMGKVITTNSATLVNKGLEVIEAHLLFDVPFDRIDVVVHPQQFIHSMVEFVDGAVVAQIGLPTMLVPIALGLGWPDRVPDAETPIDWARAADWRFEPLNDEAFPAVQLARQVGMAGSTYPAVYNAANEECVAAFHDGRISFTDIIQTVQDVVGAHTVSSGELTVDDVLEAEAWARSHAQEILGRR